MTPKTIKKPFERQVTYDHQKWNLLSNLRKQSIEVLKILEKIPSDYYIYGSVARGDVDQNSDIDIISFQKISSFKLEFLFQENTLKLIEKKLVIATPNSLPKYHLILPNEITVTIPLVEPIPRDLEFYKFGGLVNLSDLQNAIRVPGVNKKLIFIKPTSFGHIEKSLSSMPPKLLHEYGISPQIIEERKRVLRRRDKVGRTGLFVEEIIPPEISVEQKLKKLIDTNTLVKKNLKRRR